MRNGTIFVCSWQKTAFSIGIKHHFPPPNTIMENAAFFVVGGQNNKKGWPPLARFKLHSTTTKTCMLTSPKAEAIYKAIDVFGLYALGRPFCNQQPFSSSSSPKFMDLGLD
jgi:hypothetical protein